MEFRLKSVLFKISFVMLNNTKKWNKKMHDINDGSDFRLHDDYGISVPSVG